MKTRKTLTRTVLGSLLAGSLIAAGATGIAQARPDGDCMKGDRMERMAYHQGHKDGAPFGRMFKRLDLTEAQQTEVTRILQEGREAGQQRRQALRDNRQALHELATGSAYDPQRVRALADEQGRLQADMIVARTETLHRMHQVLTPEQQAEWNTLREQRQQKWQERQRKQAQ